MFRARVRRRSRLAFPALLIRQSSKRTPEAPLQHWFQGPPVLLTLFLSASVHCYRSNSESRLQAVSHEPSFLISTTDATAESLTFHQSQAFVATRLPKEAPRAIFLLDESRCIRPGTPVQPSRLSQPVACLEFSAQKFHHRASAPGIGLRT